jgi:hypothetical protein
MSDLNFRDNIKLGCNRTNTHIIKWVLKDFGLGASFKTVEEFKVHMGDSWSIPTRDQLEMVLKTINFRRETEECDRYPSGLWTCEFETITKEFGCGSFCTCDGTEQCVPFEEGMSVKCYHVYNLRDSTFKLEQPYNYRSNWVILVSIKELG